MIERPAAAIAAALLLIAACAAPSTPAPTVAPGGQNPKPAATAAATGSTANPGPGQGPVGLEPAEPAIHVFLWGRPDTTERDLRLAREAGFTWVKQRFEWRYIEGDGKGKLAWGEPDRIVDAIARAGLKVVARVDNQPKWARADDLFPGVGPPDNLDDWSEFLGALAARYRGRIQAYEIWNEPNLDREWGNRKPSAKEYAELLRVGYQAIKKADPNALVISAGLSPTTDPSDRARPDVLFLKELYAAGAAPYFDLLGIHAAGFKAEPEEDPGDVARDPAKTNHDSSPEELKRTYAFRHVEDVRKIMVENGDANKRIAILEMGWTSDPRPDSPYRWHSVTEQQKADYLVRAFKWARQNWSPWISLMTLIYIPDPAWTERDEQYYWSITRPDGSTLPAYEALKSYLTR